MEPTTPANNQPQLTNQIQSEPSRYDIPPQKNRTGLLIAIVTVILLVGVGGVGAYVFGVRLQTPEAKIIRALASHRNVATFSYEASLKGKLTPPDEEGFSLGTFSYDVSSKGKVDTAQPSPVMDMTFDVTLNGEDTRGRTSGYTNLSFIAAQEKGYVNFKTIQISHVSKIPDQTMVQVAQIFQSTLNGITQRWISFDMKSDDKPKETQREEPFSDEFFDFKFVKKIDTLPDEKINGVDTTHYKLTVDNESFKQLYNESLDVKAAYVPKQLFAAVSQSAQASGGTTDVEFWIGKKDLHFYRIAFSQIEIIDAEKDVTFSVEGSITFDDYNAPVTVTVPSSSVPAERISQQIMNSFNNPSQSVQAPAASTNSSIHIDNSVKSNISSLRASAELMYDRNNGSYLGLCKDGVVDIQALGTYGQAITKILTEKGVSTQSQAGIVCVGSSERYAVSAKLSNGQSFCVDSTGYAGIAEVLKDKITCSISTGY
jgi:hypothetical protein